MEGKIGIGENNLRGEAERRGVEGSGVGQRSREDHRSDTDSKSHGTALFHSLRVCVYVCVCVCVNLLAPSEVHSFSFLLAAAAAIALTAASRHSIEEKANRFDRFDVTPIVDRRCVCVCVVTRMGIESDSDSPRFQLNQINSTRLE